MEWNHNPRVIGDESQVGLCGSISGMRIDVVLREGIGENVVEALAVDSVLRVDVRKGDGLSSLGYHVDNRRCCRRG